MREQKLNTATGATTIIILVSTKLFTYMPMYLSQYHLWFFTKYDL